MLKKTAILIAICMVLAPACYAQKVKDGFKGHSWGTAFATIESSFDLVFMREENGYDMYWATDIDSLGGADLAWCSVSFYKNKFAAVVAVTRGRSDWDILLRSLTRVYGKPKKDNPSLDSYKWATDKTRRSYEMNRLTNEGILAMLSVEMSTQMEEDKKKKARKFRDDF